VKQDHSENFNENGLKRRLLEWLRHYLRIEPKISPYIHIFVFHLPEFILKYKNLNLFSMQGLEKKNDFIKQNFIRQTNRKKDLFTETLLKLSNRYEINYIGKE
jgi:hypothetical protein